MSSHRLCGLVLVVYAILLTSVAHAAIYHVATNGGGSTCSLGSPCGTIAIGLSKLSGAGDVLYLHGGTYNEVIGPGSYPAGSSWNNISPGGSVVWIGAYTPNGTTYENVTISGSSTNGVLAGYPGKYVVWDHLHIHATTSNESENVVIRMGPDTQLFQNGETTQAQTAPNCGPASQFTTNAVQVVILDQQHVLLPEGPWFRNNYMHNSPCGYAFYIQSFISHLTIENNDIANHGGYGIQLYSSNCVPSPCFHGVIIRNNIIRGNGFGVITDFGGIIGYGGLTAGRTDAAQIYNNVFYDNYYAMDVSRDSQNATVYNNTFYNNPFSNNGPTIQVGEDSSATIRNNISLLGGNALIGPVPGTPLGSVTQSNNLFGVDPQFVNTAGRDFHLTAGSPAVNVPGSCLAGVPTDRDGVLRPQGGNCDLGAYEFGSVSTPLPAPTNLRLQNQTP